MTLVPSHPTMQAAAPRIAADRDAPPRDSLLEAARKSLAAGQRKTGRSLLDAARAAGAAGDALDALDGRLLLDEGRPEAALALLAPAIARSPAAWELRCIMADARLAANDAAGAAAEAAEAVVAAPREPAPKAVLGSALLLLGQIEDARACLAEAVSGNPLHVGYRLCLARAQAEGGDTGAAAATLADGIALRPEARPLRLAAMRLAMAAGLPLAALALADAARAAGSFDAVILGLRGHVLSGLEREAEASESYREALLLAPEDPYVRHLVAAAGLVAPLSRASPDYVRALFDGFASHFEQDLVALHYRVPGLIRRAVLAHGAGLGGGVDVGAGGSVLDLGCGTGLVAIVLSDLTLGPLTGVDLSPVMLREAAAKNLYTRLIEGDVCDPAGFGTGHTLAVAADVLPYFGDPAPLLASAHACLAPGGLFVLTAETFEPTDGQADGDAAPWRLGPRARYGHDPAALCRLAEEQGFAVRCCTPEMLRLDRGQPVPGVVVALRRVVVS